MKPFTKEHKAWLARLKAGDKVMLAGKDCPKAEKGKVRKVKGNYHSPLAPLYVICHHVLGGDVSMYWFTSEGRFAGYEHKDYYLMPVPENMLHKFEPKHHSAAAKIKSAPKHPSQRKQIMSVILKSKAKTGVCMYRIKAALHWENGAISRRVSELHSPKFGKPFIKQTDSVQCSYCKGKGGLAHHVATEYGKEKYGATK